jgi:EAL domain-containing protein (putative c-di-GMP-specific phosphodiesterase class I)
MGDSRSAAVTLQRLRDRQIQISIDDFGTGYSSLSYLHSFPVDTLKIDRSFVQNIDQDSETLGLVPVIISIAKTTGMTVVAEGIETTQQLTQLRRLKCEFGQGFFFAKPLEAKAAEALVTQGFRW